MRIVHVVHQYLPEFIGGVELYTQMIARYQVELGHEVTIFTPSITAVSESEAGVHIWRVPVGKQPPTRILLNTVWGEAQLTAAWQRLLDETQPDVVHIQHLMGVPAALPDELRQRRIPYVVTLHDFWYGCANAQLLTNDTETLCEGPRYFINCGRCALARAGVSTLWAAPLVAPLFAYRQKLLRKVLDGAEIVVVPAAFVEQAYARMGFETKKMTIVPHGIDLPEPLPSKTAARQTAGLNVVYIGGIAPQKGVHILVDAFQTLPHKDASLTIYGDLNAFPEYVAQMQTHNLHPAVRFAGRVPHHAIWQIVATADLVAVPTQWYEAFGLIVSEAFAVGTPVLASDIGVIGERIRHGIDGWLVKPDDVSAWAAALQHLYQNPTLVVRLSEQTPSVKTAAEHVAELDTIYQIGTTKR